MTLKEIIKKVYESGVGDFDEIDTNWDPSDIQEGIDETFEEYWANEGEDIVDKIVKLNIIDNE